MKKLSLCFAFFLIMKIGYTTTPVMAQESGEYDKIKNVLERFINDFAIQDLDSAMQLVSNNYSHTQRGVTIDYAKFKANLEKAAAAISKQYIGVSLGNIEILRFIVRDDDAFFDVQYVWRGFNLDSLNETSRKLKRRVFLTKKSGTWKIKRWFHLK